MKYALVNTQNKRIQRVSETKPMMHPEQVAVIEISDEDARLINAEPRKPCWFVDDTVTSENPNKPELPPQVALLQGLIQAWNDTFTEGEKALLEPVYRKAVATFRNGDIEGAKAIIASLPADISETLAGKRDFILSLFPKNE